MRAQTKCCPNACAHDSPARLLVYVDLYPNLTDASAKAILREVVAAASGWSSVARRADVNSEEIARFEPTLNDCVALVSARS